MEDRSEEAQWSDVAREQYIRCAEDLIAALKAHVALNIERTGRQRELASYFASCEALKKAAKAFDGAEFDWCGSFPLSLMDDDEIDGFDDDDEDEVDEAVGPESVLSGGFGGLHQHRL